MMERTLVFFKPDALERDIVADIYERFIFVNGFRIVSIRPRVVTRDLIFKHYAENLKNEDIEIVERVYKFYEGKLIVLLVLERANAIFEMRKILGASDPIKSDENTIRGYYCDDSYERAEYEKRSCRNIMHASDSREAFDIEYRLWFDS